MTDVRITDTGDFDRLAKRLRAAGNELERELAAALDRSTGRLDEAVRASALANLPQHGGLNEEVAASRITSRRLGPLELLFGASGLEQLPLINKGRVAHPTYGHRPRVLQLIPRARDWFYKPMRRSAPGVRREIERAMHRVARRLTS
jgi:hypothetical protein